MVALKEQSHDLDPGVQVVLHLPEDCSDNYIRTGNQDTRGPLC